MSEVLNDSNMTAASDRLAVPILEVLSHADDPQSVADLEQDLDAIL